MHIYEYLGVRGSGGSPTGKNHRSRIRGGNTDWTRGPGGYNPIRLDTVRVYRGNHTKCYE